MCVICHELALPLVEARGRFVTVGFVAYKEYRSEKLSIRYLQGMGHLEVWHGRKVLSVNREYGKLIVRHYTPGPWEAALEEAVKHTATTSRMP